MVYIGGSYMENKQRKACYWVDGVRYDLDGFEVASITAIDGKVYAAGHTIIDGCGYWGGYPPISCLQTCYWADGIRHYLPGSIVNGIFDIGDMSVDQGNVYISGWESHDDKRCYWINGVRQKLPSDGVMWNVYAANGVVYMVGHYFVDGIIKACFWKNGIRYDLPGPKGFLAFKIRVINNTEYIIGYGHRFFKGYREKKRHDACYWINGNRLQKDIPSVPLADSFAVSDGNVYIRGRKKGFFINGVYTHSKLPYAMIDDICTYAFTVSQNKIYEVGSLFEKACYWIDGVRYELNGYRAGAIYVTE